MSKATRQEMLKGNITISTPSGLERGKGVDYVQIELEDKLSHTLFLRIHMNYRDFARAVTGHGVIPCEFELHADRVGLVREHKHEEVFIADGEFATRKKRAAEAVAALEVDGWMGRLRDASNPHRLVRRDRRGGLYSVSFVRYVEPEEDGEKADEC